MEEKPARVQYHLPILVDVERLGALYVASLAERPDLIGIGDHMMEALGELGTALLDELEAERECG